MPGDITYMYVKQPSFNTPRLQRCSRCSKRRRRSSNKLRRRSSNKLRRRKSSLKNTRRKSTPIFWKF